VTGPRRAARTLAAALVTALLAAGCGTGTTPPPPPRPTPTAADVPELALVDVGAPVRERITRARDAVTSKLASANAWGELGIVLDAHGFFAEAVACYTMASGLDPTAVRWPYLAGTVLSHEEPEEAVLRFERAATLDPDSALVRHAWGDALLAVGRDDEAELRFREALERDANARRALLGLAELALRRDDLDAAAGRLDRAAALAFHDRSVHAMLARLHQARSEPARAAREVLFVRAYPDQAAVGDPHRVLVERAAVGPKAYTKRGLALTALGMNREAERAFRLALQQTDSFRNRLNLAGVIGRQGRHEEALALLRETLATHPNEPDVHNHTAVVHMDLGNLDAATDELEATLALDARHDGAHYNLGRVHERSGRRAEAEASYRTAIEINPVNAAPHAALATLLSAQGATDEALAHWRDAADFGRDAPEYVVGYAMAVSRRGAFGDAVPILLRALERHQADVSLLATAVTILATCPVAEYRDGPTAVRLAQRLVEQSGGRERASALDLLAAAHAEAGDFPAALRAAGQALELARAQGNARLARVIESHIALYRSGRPYHQPGG
jgi:tetratricopeptide (TPR) repeat protein